MQQEYVIARLTNDNLADLERLHEAVYKHKVRAGYYNNKYDTTYTGVAYIGYIAYSRQQEPVAYFGVIPCFMEYAGHSILAAQAADAMTHPAHRYKGMVTALIRLTFDLCRESGVQLVFGFPNQNFYPVAIRMGWKEGETIERFEMRIHALPLASLAARWSFTRAWYQRYQRSVLARYTCPLAGVSSSAVSGNAAGVQRSALFLEYKKYNDTQVLQIGHAKLWVKLAPVLFIGDMEQVNENNFDSVMGALKKICRRLGIRRLSFQISPGTPLHLLWSARYSALPSFHLIFQDFGAGVPLEQIKFTFADIDIF